MEDTFALDKTYTPAEFETQIYERWQAARVFHAQPDQRPPERRYVIMMPLPNVTGALHMGHAMDNVMQDMLARFRRMRGDNTLWLPGTDHAGIATQAVVEKRLKELEGVTRHEIGREGLVARIWQWKDQFQERIVAQQKRMGCGADWERQRFTMDAVCSRAVRHCFMRMFEDGLIFRGKRLVNWDPYLQTSISDDEVYHETVQGHFWHLRYPVIDPQAGEPTHLVVATTRPETMLGDTAVAVHPAPADALAAALEAARADLARADQKTRPAAEAHLHALEARRRDLLPTLERLRDMAQDDRHVMLPLLDRPIPIICDEWAKPEFGSGCVKITPAHDPNDYDVWQRHRDHIGIINILNPDGSLASTAGPYAGLDRFAARERVVADFEARGLLAEVEERSHEVGHSDRSKTPIEPYLSDQWYVRMGDLDGGVSLGRGTTRAHRSEGLVQAAINAIEDGRVRFHPARFTKTCLDWLAEKRDWPISRQLWWGHRIPVWSRRTSVGELDSLLARGSLQRLLADPRVSVRVVLPEQEQSLPWRGGAHGIEQPAESPCLVDFCLLTDDEELVTLLEKEEFVRDPDVLDTWFSSALWPHSTLGWPDPNTADTEGGAPLGGPEGMDALSYYYPGSCLVTARDIITLWVARMVLMGLYNLGEVPFKDVFIHANILDGKGERMSKSKGNGIDPVDIIEEYGTDAMRYVLCDMQTGNQDIRLPVEAICPRCGAKNDLAALRHGRSVFTYLCGGCREEFDVLGTMDGIPAAKLMSERFVDGRRFCNKLWNSVRFALHVLHDVPCRDLMQDAEALAPEDRWILAALNEATETVSSALAAYNPSAALGAARDFMWGALCDWYLELIKPRLAADDGGAATARQVLAFVLDRTLRLLHPFVPFITEHLYQRLNEQVPVRGLGGERTPAPALLAAADWPIVAEAVNDKELLESFARAQRATSAVREVRSSYRISPHQQLVVTLRAAGRVGHDLERRAHVIGHMARASEVRVLPDASRPPGAASVVVDDFVVFVHDVTNDEIERARLEKELHKCRRDVEGSRKRLANEAFLARAPASVVAEHRARLESSQRQVRELEEALDAL